MRGIDALAAACAPEEAEEATNMMKEMQLSDDQISKIADKMIQLLQQKADQSSNDADPSEPDPDDQEPESDEGGED